MPSGKGTYGSEVGRPKKKKRMPKMDGMMVGRDSKKDLGNRSARREMHHGGKPKRVKKAMGRIMYMDGGPVMDNTPMAKPN